MNFEDWRRQVRFMIQARTEWQVIAEASDGSEAVQNAEELRPDLILLDIDLTKLNGIEAARKMRQLCSCRGGRTLMESVSQHRAGPRFLIADDHAIFAEVLRGYLEKTYTVVGVVLDVIVADVSMPLLNGLDAARRISKQAPNIKFIFLTMRDDPNLAASALDIGPVGFVLKHSTGSELLNAIHSVLRGKPYLAPKLRAEDWVATKARARQFSKELTQRQRDIVQLYAEGLHINQIAVLLNLSNKTVEFHKHHIMRAFNLQSNADLVLFAVKQGLVSIKP
jgi:DNA-binding NarL/FixJ family response regulator